MKTIYRFILVCCCLSTWSLIHAQSIDIDWESELPPFTACQSEPVLSIDLSGLTANTDYEIELQASNQFVIVALIDSACTSGLIPNGGGSYSLGINIPAGTTCNTKLSVLVACNNSNTGTSLGSLTASLYDGSSTLLDTDSLTNVSVTRPAIQWFVNICGGPARNSFLGATEVYTYNISAQNAPVRYLQLHWNLESEVATQPQVDITYFGTTTVTYTPDVNNDLLIDILTDGGALLQSTDTPLEIEVSYEVLACSPSGSQQTVFTAAIVCYPESIENMCNQISCATNINVQQSVSIANGLRWRPANTATSLADYTVSVPVAPCDSIDYSYFFSQGLNPNFPAQAQIADLDTFFFDINQNILDVGDSVLINGFAVLINDTNGICYTQGLGNNLTRFNFNLVQSSYPSGWPLVEGNTPGNFNALLPNQRVVITFADCKVNCNYLGQCHSAIGGLAGSGEFNLEYKGMCSSGTVPYFRPMRNYFSQSSYLESETTDLDFPGDNDADVNYNYDLLGGHGDLGGLANNPWKYTHIYNVGAGIMFDCDSAYTHLVMNFDPWLSLDTGIVVINGDTLAFNYTPVIGVDEEVHIPIGNNLPEGVIRFAIVNDDCNTGSFGMQKVRTRMESYCASTGCEDVCPIVTGCDSIPFYIHCDGLCTPGFPLGTASNGFQLRRSSFGMTENYTDIADGDFETAIDSGLVLSRAYQCDQITINACGGTNTFFDYDTLQEVFFEIAFPTDAAASFDNFDFSTIAGTFTLVADSGCTSLVSPTSISISFADLEIIHRDTADFVRIHLPTTVTPFDNLLSCSYSICLEATLDIASDIEAPMDDGFHSIPQIRGQYGSTTTGEGTTFSCDSWGANFTVLSIRNTFAWLGWDQIGNNFSDTDFGADCNNCVMKMVLETRTVGGYPDADDFPNEIRPTLQWPDEFIVDNMNNIEFSHAYYWSEENETYDQNLSSNNFLPVDTVNLGAGVVGLTGIASATSSTGPCTVNQNGPTLTTSGQMFNDWPTVDKDANTRQRMIVVFKDACSVDTTLRSASIEGTYTELPCQTDTTTTYLFSDTTATADNMTMSILNNVWTINSFENPHPVSLQLRFNMYDSAPIPNAFIYIPDSTVTGVTVTQSSGSACGFNLTDMGGGLWQLGSICAGAYHTGAPYLNTFYTINFDINYECVAANGAAFYVPIYIPIYYGFDCDQQFTDGSVLVDEIEEAYPCYHNQSVIELIPQPSGIAVNVDPLSIEVDACSDFGVDFVVSSIEEADVYDLSALLSSDGLSISSIDVTYDNDVTNIPGPFSDPYSLDLAGIIGGAFPGGHFLPNSNPSIEIHLNMEAPCSGGVYDIELDVLGYAACSDTLNAINDIEVTVTAPLSSYIDAEWPSDWSCTDSSNHAVLEILDILTGAGSYTASLNLPTAVSIVNSTPAVSSSVINGLNTTHYWNLSSPDSSETIEFDLVLPSNFCDSLNLAVTGINNAEDSCWHACAFTESYNLYACCQSCSADFTITQTSDCCYLVEDLTPDVMPCPEGGFGIFRADTSWVATYQGVTSFEHCFEEDGDYLICSTVCCADSSLDKVCQLITVTGCNDECEGFEITAINDGCDYTFTAVHPPVNSPTYGWWVGYNGIVEWNNTGVLNHTYPPGYYQDVCYTVFYNDSITNEPMECKVCMPIEVNCEPDCDVFDMQHTEKGDCKHGFEAILPPNFNGTNVSYCWYMDYSNTTFCPAGSSVGFTYPAGTYTVCYEITYTDSNYAEPVTCKVCREYEFKCDKAEEFCYIIERKDVPDEGKVITPLKDGGYLVSGEMHGNGTNLDMYFAQVKDDFTSDYNYLLNEVIGELSDIGTVYSTLEVGNKVYILGKSTKSDATSADLVLACLDAPTQNVLWAKRHGTTKMDIGSKILLLNESTLLITGHTNYYGSANDSYDLFAMTTDLSGNLMAVEVYQPTEFASSEISTDAVLIPDSHGQFVIAGYNINAQGKRDMVALKLNTDLTPASNMLFIGDSKDDWANGITIAGDYIYLVGATGDLKYKDYHIYVAEVKTNSFTQTIASRVYTPQYKASVANKVIHENGSLVLVGDLYSNENDADRYRGTLLQLICNDKDSKHLDVLWSAKTLEEEKNVRFNHLTAYQEARLLVTGMLDHAENEQDIFVVNVDIKTGEGCCVEPLSYEKKLQNKSSDRTTTSNRPLWEVKAYGQRSTHFALVEICKKEDKVGNPEAGASVKMLHSDFNVFPNPNAGYFSVQLSNSDDMFQSVTIFDTAGRKVFDKNYSNEKSGMSHLEINADDLTNGVYLLQVEGLYGTNTKLISISK